MTQDQILIGTALGIAFAFFATAGIYLRAQLKRNRQIFTDSRRSAIGNKGQVVTEPQSYYHEAERPYIVFVDEDFGA